MTSIGSVLSGGGDCIRAGHMIEDRPDLNFCQRFLCLWNCDLLGALKASGGPWLLKGLSTQG